MGSLGELFLDPGAFRTAWKLPSELCEVDVLSRRSPSV